MKNLLIKIILFIILLSPVICKAKDDKVILSFSGGGGRGIISLVVADAIESRLKKHTYLIECVDITSGTSTGSIIAAALNLKDKNGKPKYKVRDVLEIYEHLAKKIFQESFISKITFGLFYSKYSNDTLIKHLNQYFGDYELKNTISNVIIPAYEVTMEQMVFFKTTKAKTIPDRNYYLKDITLASSSAPTYFDAAKINNVLNNQELILIDGGVGENNPSAAAAVYALDIYGKDTKLLVISIGTGTNYKKNRNYDYVTSGGVLSWYKKLIPLLMHANDGSTDYKMNVIFNNHNHNYYMLDTFIDKEFSAMDNVSDDIIKKWKEYGYKIVKDNEDAINEIVNRIE